MTCRQRAASVVVLCGLVSAPPAVAQTKVFVANAVYESADLVAPNAVLLISASDSSPSGGLALASSVRLRGSTLTVDSVKSFSPRLGILFGGSLTPFSANGSSRIYKNGRHEPDLAFTDRSYQAEAGVRLQPTPAWRTDIQLLALKESVEGIDNHSWSHPYGGIEVTQNYRRVISEDLLQSCFDGFNASAAAQRFFGSSAWWRGQVMASGGKRIGNLFLRGQAVAFGGGDLNAVSRFLVGGSWDVGEGLPLYGFHYAQFRVDRGVVLDGGVDLRLKGAWEVGIRGGYLDSPDKWARGMAIRLGTIWNGVAWHVGAGLPARVSGEAQGGAFLFAGITAAVIQ
jgi:hypothetical protein